MKKSTRISTTLIIISLFFCSCNKTSDRNINFIPSDASSVALINVKQIKEKNTNLSGIIDYIAGETDDIISKIYNSGIDLDNNIYAYTGKIDEETPYNGAIFTISNIDQFKNTLKNELKCTIEEKDDFLTGILPKKKGIITWKENTGLFINIPDIQTSKKVLGATEKSQQLISTSEHFKKSINDENDITFWVNLNETKSIAHYLDPRVAAVQDELDLTDSYLTSKINFNKGDLRIENTILGNEKTFSKQEALFGNQLSNSVLNTAPGENLILAYLLSVNLDEILELMNSDQEVKDDIHEFLSRFNVTPEALNEAITGDASITINGLDGFIPLNYKAAVVLGIKNKSKSEEILNNLSEFGLVYNEEKELYEHTFFLAKMNRNTLVLAGPNIDFAKQIFQGKTKTLSDIDINNSNGEFFLDLEGIPSLLMNNATKVVPVLKEFKSISSSSKFGENHLENNIIIKLKNEEINSLSVLSQHGKELM